MQPTSVLVRSRCGPLFCQTAATCRPGLFLYYDIWRDAQSHLVLDTSYHATHSATSGSTDQDVEDDDVPDSPVGEDSLADGMLPQADIFSADTDSCSTRHPANT